MVFQTDDRSIAISNADEATWRLAVWAPQAFFRVPFGAPRVRQLVPCQLVPSSSPGCHQGALRGAGAGSSATPMQVRFACKALTCRRRDSNPHGHSPTVFKSVGRSERSVMTIHGGTCRVAMFPGALPVASPSEYMEIHGEERGDMERLRLRCRQKCRQRGSSQTPCLCARSLIRRGPSPSGCKPLLQLGGVIVDTGPLQRSRHGRNPDAVPSVLAPAAARRGYCSCQITLPVVSM
jgi:hypothetical protein